MKEPRITVGQDILQLIAEIDEFKGLWQAFKTVSPERLQQLRNAIRTVMYTPTYSKHVPPYALQLSGVDQ